MLTTNVVRRCAGVLDTGACKLTKVQLNCLILKKEYLANVQVWENRYYYLKHVPHIKMVKAQHPLAGLTSKLFDIISNKRLLMI